MSNQERRLMRRLGIGAGVTTSPYNQPVDPRANLIQETDWQRNRLAEELLKIGLEEIRTTDFTDGHRREPVIQDEVQAYVEEIPVLTVEQWLVKLANAALKAAEVVYPELPSGREITEQTGHLPAPPPDHPFPQSYPLPAAAQEGAQSVGGSPVERPAEVIEIDESGVVHGAVTGPLREG